MADGKLPSSQSFNLDWIPTPKARPRVTRRGTYTPEETRIAEQSLAWELKARGAICYPARQALAVDLYIRLPRPPSAKGRKWPMVKPDLDQYVKSILDAGNGVLWADDGQVCAVSARKVYGLTVGLVLLVELLLMCEK